MPPPVLLSTLEPDAAGFVLAGGRSTRMGTDKALVEFRGRPLVAHALGILSGAGLGVSIAGARADLNAYAPVVEDAEPGHGPLGGICASLASTSARWAVFLPVDLPLLPSSLVRFLVHRARTTGNAITLASAAGFVQTFPAVLDRTVLPALQSQLAAGNRGCLSVFQTACADLTKALDVVAVEPLAQGGEVAHRDGFPAEIWFLNINSADNLRQAEASSPGFIA